jgi:uncharacterized protein (TIGR03066 family)
MYRLVACLLPVTALAAVAAPVPKEKPNPHAAKLVGTWHYHYEESDKEPLLICGTARVTFAADGAMSTSFGLPNMTGLFRDGAGTYKLTGDALAYKLTVGKGSKDEHTSDATLTIVEVTEDRLRYMLANDEKKRVMVYERVKPYEKTKEDNK